MLKNEQIKALLAELKEMKYDVGLRDLSYVILSHFIEDASQVYRVTHGENPDLPFELYDSSERIGVVEKKVSELVFSDENKVEAVPTGDDFMSFDEIKKGLIEDMNALIALRDMTDANGDAMLDAKEMASVVGRIADIRVKLTEKFGATDKSEEHRVVVMNKYDAICPYCHHEVSVRR